jgi:hypothetical protein
LSDPRALIELVDDWRERGFFICARELETIVNAHPRDGVWISGADLDKAKKRADDKVEPRQEHIPDKDHLPL